MEGFQKGQKVRLNETVTASVRDMLVTPGGIYSTRQIMHFRYSVSRQLADTG